MGSKQVLLTDHDQASDFELSDVAGVLRSVMGEAGVWGFAVGLFGAGAVLLQLYYNPTTTLLQPYYNPTTTLLQPYYNPILQSYYNPTTTLLQPYNPILQPYYNLTMT